MKLSVRAIRNRGTPLDVGDAPLRLNYTAAHYPGGGLAEDMYGRSLIANPVVHYVYAPDGSDVGIVFDDENYTYTVSQGDRTWAIKATGDVAIAFS